MIQLTMELSRYLIGPIKMNVRKGERVLILSDYKTDRRIQEALVNAVFFQEAHPVLMVIPPLGAYGNEPPEMVAKAALECDLIIGACSTSVSHTDATRAARNKGIRYFVMGGATVESLTNGAATANYEQVFSLSKKIADVCTKGSSVHVTSLNGTNIKFSIENRKAFPLAGVILDEIRMGGPLGGEAALAPLEGTANGVIVVDGSVHHLGLLKNEIRLTVQDGRAIKIEGSEEADRLVEFLKINGDDNSTNIAEFAIGTNPKSKFGENTQEVKTILGTVHFALGDNMSLGGHTYSKLHMDLVLKKPTVRVDDVMIVEDGKVLVKND